MKRGYHRRGFTIVELLVVIVVIAILAAITVVAYNGIRVRAQASYIASDIKKIEKGFRLFATTSGQSSWWLDTSLTGTANPDVTSVMSSTGLSEHLSSLPNVPGYSSTIYRYDNDGDTLNIAGCGVSGAGVNILIGTISQEVWQELDTKIDDGQATCGRLRYWGPGDAQYTMSGTQPL